MSDLIVQFNNASNWLPFFNAVYTATPTQAGRYVPIPPRTLPIASDERILALKAVSNDAKPSWKTGGWLTPLFDLSSTPLLEAGWKSYQIPLRRAGLMLLPGFGLTYQLRLEIPKWLQHVEISIWQYTGPIDDSTEKLIRELASELNINL